MNAVCSLVKKSEMFFLTQEQLFKIFSIDGASKAAFFSEMGTNSERIYWAPGIS